MTNRKPPASYTPTEVDLKWARNVIALLAECGVIAYPATNMIYRISHKGKTMTLQNPEQLLSFPSFVIHYQTIDVFAKLGYRVLPSREEVRLADPFVGNL